MYSLGQTVPKGGVQIDYLVSFQLVLLLVVIVMRKRVKFVAALFREASECIKAMPCLLLQPLWTFLALFVFFIYWMIVMIALATAGNVLIPLHPLPHFRSISRFFI